ncbi:MAG: HAD hydrolase-like protein [Candidatus Dojkabacteria bacterium]|nr:MAG: HAD hydrolase-like protein [Candidatus Dojkabacteria bacterium]
MKKHFIFDVDDTLTNSYEINQQLFVDTFLAVDKSADEQYLRDLHYRNRGVSMLVQFAEAISHLGWDIDPAEMVKRNEEMHINSAELFAKMHTFDAAKELLEVLKKNGKLISACTNRQYGSQKKIFEVNHMTHYFENVISCSDEGHEKPDPYCLIKLIEKYDEPKDSYIYFGDSKTDRDFAKGAGIDFVIIDQYLNEKRFYKMILESFF